VAAAPKPDRYDVLEAYVADLQAALNVSYWKITVARDASDVEAWADINPHAQAETAELRVSHDFWKQTPELQREGLVHEMMHVVNARLDQTIEAMEEALGKIAWAIFEPQYEDATERVVDHLAKVIAPGLPLPEFPKA
jgi:hypothetical protein